MALVISDAQRQALRRRVGRTVQLCPDHHWVEIELFDSKGNHVGGEAYSVRLPTDETITGTLDADGWARVDYQGAGGECQVCFPNLDKAEWRPHATTPLGPKKDT